MSKKFTKWIGIIIAVSLTLGLFLGVGAANYKVAKAEGENLLVNPGAETGDLTGWIDSSAEKCWMVGFAGSIKGWEHPGPKSGTYYFMTGWPSDSGVNRYLYQDVNVSSYVGMKVTFSGYLGGYGHTDKSGLKLELRDESGKVLDSKASDMVSIDMGDWTKYVELSLDIPAGAYTARAYLVGVLHEGNEADSYFDDLSLTVSGTAVKETKLGQVKNVKATNKKGRHIHMTFKAVSGAEGYQIKYGTKKNMKGAKTISTTITDGYFMNSKNKKVAFKKGSTYYIQVRAYAKNASGKTVYGKWSSKAKVKIKK